MNDPNKVIDLNLSSLLSLKAELLRKQTEVSKKKSQTPEEHAAQRSNGTFLKKPPNNQTENENIQQDAGVEVENDDQLLANSQRILQQKSKFYERMCRSGGALNTDDNCLVLFNRKQQNNESAYEKNEFSDNDREHDNASDQEEDWVEFKDCLGRTRKCLREDLEHVKKRDAELANSMPERLDQTKANWMIDNKKLYEQKDNDDCSTIGPMPTESLLSEALTIMSKKDEVRAKWEDKELENLEKKGVHYQDVFFDEARQHGVGYYAFSTVEKERERQQQELEETRQATIQEQEHREALRIQREEIIAQRVLAAKNRQRARLGQPPLEMSDIKEEKAKLTKAEKLETKEVEKINKKQEKAKRKLQKIEATRELERKQHIRPWDKTKLGAGKSTENDLSDTEEKEEEEWVYKPERHIMSQHEWNEYQGSQRNPEFAPRLEVKQNKFPSMPHTYKIPNDTIGTFANYQSSKFKRRNYESETDNSFEATNMHSVPPPKNLDMPTTNKKPKTRDALENSIEAGLKFLRDSADISHGSKHSWAAKQQYT